MTEPADTVDMEPCSRCGEMYDRGDLYSDPGGGPPLCELCLEELEQKEE